MGDIKSIRGNNLPYCDLWIGGFPCQDISAAGKMRGFDFKSATRSSLGWEMIRLLSEIKEKPKYVIFENVSMITSKKFKDTLNLFKKDLEEISYTLYDEILCAADYGIPQSRKRYFLVAILNNCKKFTFPKGMTDNQCLKNLLEKTVDEKYYLTDCSYVIDKNNNRVFSNIKNHNVKYVINYSKYLNGGVCGKNMNDNFNQSSRLFSSMGIAPTLTASNTANNCKIVVEEEN